MHEVVVEDKDSVTLPVSDGSTPLSHTATTVTDNTQLAFLQGKLEQLKTKVASR